MGFSKHLKRVGIKKLDQARGTDGAKSSKHAFERSPGYSRRDAPRIHQTEARRKFHHLLIELNRGRLKPPRESSKI